jgi:hypothetical protein
MESHTNPFLIKQHPSMGEPLTSVVKRPLWSMQQISKLTENLSLILANQMQGYITFIISHSNDSSNIKSLVFWINAESQKTDISENNALVYCLHSRPKKIEWRLTYE